MKKIILASASPQRRKLMKILGLPFIVRPSRAQEITTITSNCAIPVDQAWIGLPVTAIAASFKASE